MGIGFLASWIVTFTSAAALVICIREVVSIGLFHWELRQLRTPEYWMNRRDRRLDDVDARELVMSDDRFKSLMNHIHDRETLSEDVSYTTRHLAVMLGLGFIAALGTVFGLLTVG
jgi:hypothetical protein